MLALRDDKFMRVLLMFDIPTKSKKEQKYATRFRNELIKQGFFMMQFSVYMRICKGISAAKSAVERVRGILPPLGNVRTLIITEKQFDNMQILLGSAGFNERVNDDKNLVLFAFDEKIGDYRYGSEDSKDLAKSMGESCESNAESSADSKCKSNANNKKHKKPVEQSLFEF
ncbi:CRISPR-associated endonuclease Cas2 [Helicobacter sp. 23-1048]